MGENVVLAEWASWSDICPSSNSAEFGLSPPMALDRNMETTMEKTPDCSDHVKSRLQGIIRYIRRLGLCQFAPSNVPRAASRAFLLESYAVATCPRSNFDVVVL
jgi:hypothetical protein